VPVIGGTRTIGNDHENKSINNEGVCGGVFGCAMAAIGAPAIPLVELHLYLIKVSAHHIELMELLDWQ